MSPRPGDVIEVRMTKWGGLPHWEFSCFYLGADEHGEWLGIPAGTVFLRPGVRHVGRVAQVGLIPPRQQPDSDRWWFATFHAPGGPVLVYVDVTDPPTWSGSTPSGSTLWACDLDLDVVRALDETVYVDDEDEFAEHQVRYSYPPDVIAAARSSADRLVWLMTVKHPPYDDTPARWFGVLDEVQRSYPPSGGTIS